MKYLQKYKFFESRISDILEDIKDIFLNLSDLGYWIYVSPTPMTIVGRNIKGEYFVRIDKLDKKTFIENAEALETIITSLEHLLNYIKETNLELISFYYDNSSFNLLTNLLITSEKTIREILEETFENSLDTDIGEYIHLSLKEK
jgi:hypothetical protein